MLVLTFTRLIDVFPGHVGVAELAGSAGCPRWAVSQPAGSPLFLAVT
jgi:hypothetical protein